MVASEVVAQSKDVLGRVLVHRGIGIRAYDNDSIGGVANHEHEHAEQSSILESGGDKGNALGLAGGQYPTVENEPKGCKYNNTDDSCRPTISIEGDTK